MKNKYLLLFTLTFSGIAFSQVGINTEDPAATLDVVASPAVADRIDGLIAPRLKGSELKAKDALYTATQDAAIVYVTEALPSAYVTDKTSNVTTIGYYYFDKTVGDFSTVPISTVLPVHRNRTSFRIWRSSCGDGCHLVIQPKGQTWSKLP